MPAVDRHQVAFRPLSIAAAAAQHQNYLRYSSYSNCNSNPHRQALLSGRLPSSLFGKVTSQGYSIMTGGDERRPTGRAGRVAETASISRINDILSRAANGIKSDTTTSPNNSDDNNSSSGGDKMLTLAKDRSQQPDVIGVGGGSPFSQLRVVSFYDSGEEVKEHAPGHRSVSRSAGFKLASEEGTNNDGDKLGNGHQRRVEGEIEEVIDYIVDPEQGGPPKCRRHSRTMTTTERRRSQPGVSMVLQTSACAVEEFVSGKELLPELLQHLRVNNREQAQPKTLPTMAPIQNQESNLAENGSKASTASVTLNGTPSREAETNRLANRRSFTKPSKPSTLPLHDEGIVSDFCSSSSTSISSSNNANNNEDPFYGRQTFAQNWRSSSPSNNNDIGADYRRSSTSSSTSTASSNGYVTSPSNATPTTSVIPAILAGPQQPQGVIRKFNSFPTTMSSTFTRPTNGYSRYSSMRMPSSSSSPSTANNNNLLLNHHIRRSSDLYARSAALLAKYL